MAPFGGQTEILPRIDAPPARGLAGRKNTRYAPMILGLRPKPRRYGAAILQASPSAPSLAPDGARDFDALRRLLQLVPETSLPGHETRRKTQPGPEAAFHGHETRRKSQSGPETAFHGHEARRKSQSGPETSLHGHKAREGPQGFSSRNPSSFSAISYLLLVLSS